MNDRSAAAQSFESALAARRSGDGKGMLSGFLMALALSPDTPEYRREAVNLLGVTSGYKSLPAPVMDALRSCVADPSLDAQPLSLVLKTVMEADARFAALENTLAGPESETERRISDGAWDWFLTEPLLHGVLARAIVIGVRMERVLTGLRQHALFHPGSVLSTRYRGFLTALALQADTARYAWIESAEETRRLEQTPEPLLHALYRPLTDLSDTQTDQLPEVLRAARRTRIELKERAQRFPTFTPVSDETSKRVQDQYEHFPYPPWDALGDITPTTLQSFATSRFSDQTCSVPASPNILSAGCGTGRGAIMLALTFPDAAVTALDLSRASLAYAALKAEQLQAANMTFGVGDILDVGALNASFDVIESSGVLHHMADPAAGLQALASILKPGGLMRLALYSERGRDTVISARALIAEHKIPDTDAGVRKARELLMTLPDAHLAHGVVDSPEFHTLDGLHDLIFNVQESRTSPAGLKKLLAGSGLMFLGFDVSDPAAKAAYARAHPADPLMRDLDNWETFEQNNPSVFAEMYQFWCRKI